nr:MAG TPA: hypothetical protein [Caudoviricetes sp.]
MNNRPGSRHRFYAHKISDAGKTDNSQLLHNAFPCYFQLCRCFGSQTLYFFCNATICN